MNLAWGWFIEFAGVGSLIKDCKEKCSHFFPGHAKSVGPKQASEQEDEISQEPERPSRSKSLLKQLTTCIAVAVKLNIIVRMNLFYNDQFSYLFLVQMNIQNYILSLFG